MCRRLRIPCRLGNSIGLKKRTTHTQQTCIRIRLHIRGYDINSLTGRLDTFYHADSEALTGDAEEWEKWLTKRPNARVQGAHAEETRIGACGDTRVTMRPWLNKSLSFAILGLFLVALGNSLCFLWPTVFHQILQKVSVDDDYYIHPWQHVFIGFSFCKAEKEGVRYKTCNAEQVCNALPLSCTRCIR